MTAVCWVMVPFALVGVAAIIFAALFRLALATEARR